MTITEEEYLKLALDEVDEQWELYRGVPTRKPGMTAAHNETMCRLGGMLYLQLDAKKFDGRVNAGRIRLSADSYYIPDAMVMPMDLVRPQLGKMTLEFYGDPLPLAVEVWSPIPEDYDIQVKLLDYQRRGDLEIWRIHPYERTLTAWVRQADGSYAESLYRGGILRPTTLPGVAIDLDRLFA